MTGCVVGVYVVRVASVDVRTFLVCLMIGAGLGSVVGSSSSNTVSTNVEDDEDEDEDDEDAGSKKVFCSSSSKTVSTNVDEDEDVDADEEASERVGDNVDEENEALLA